MIISAKLYYNHLDKDGHVDDNRQLASITLSKGQESENVFFLEVFIHGEDGEPQSTLIGFYPQGMILKTNSEILQGSDDTIFIRAFRPENNENT